jgi:hypothetical protein
MSEDKSKITVKIGKDYSGEDVVIYSVKRRQDDGAMWWCADNDADEVVKKVKDKDKQK